MSLENTYKGKHLHIVAFDIPVPANYGGAIDIFYKLKALYDAGVIITLHCYEYDRKPSKLLNKFCKDVFYYPREVNKTNLLKFKPYIVATRNSPTLLKNLLKDESPILFEGLHSCYYLNSLKLANRFKVVRTHNVEHHYYSNLAKVEKDIFKKYYYLHESAKLKKYEKVLKHAQAIAAISKNDYLHFSKSFANVNIISAFHPHERIDINEGLGKYALYHGSLDVAENNEAALFLIKTIFNDTPIPLIIAGNKVSKELKQEAAKYAHVTIKSNIKTEEIHKLVKEAHVNILPTFQATGIKLKLLAALYTGRFCLVNTPMVENTGLEELCDVKDSPEKIKQALYSTFKKPFTKKDIEKREVVLKNNGFSNAVNCQRLLTTIFQ